MEVSNDRLSSSAYSFTHKSDRNTLKHGVMNISTHLKVLKSETRRLDQLL